jgi:hypothetical protein
MVPTEFKVGEDIAVPPLAAVYHNIPVEEANAALASRVWIGLVSHCVIVDEPDNTGAGGAVLMVKVTAVLVRLWHPLVVLVASA